MFKFDLDLIDSQEITCEYNIDFVKDTNDKKDKLNYPKVYYINIRKNIYEFDRDILLLKQDKENKYIKPLLTSNFNINNNNSIFIQKDFIDLAQKTLLSNNNSNIDLLILILDETCNEIKEEDNIFISFRFYGGYHDLMHYEEDISIDKFFNEKNNKIMIKMSNCRPQYFFNYFNQNSDSQNDERILDIESSIGHMNLYYMNKISGKNLDEYFDILGQKCIHKFQNSLLTGNFGALKISCDDNNPVMSYIYAHKKNKKEDIINFMNQKSLIYIEYNTQYTLKFNEQEKENEFDFRIKILRTNIQEEDYKIDISYNNQNLNLDQAHNEQFFKHSKGIDSEILIKINSNNNNTNNNIDNTGFILEIFKGIDLAEEKIKYIEKETEQEDLSADNIITFIYSKDEINSANNKIELYNTNNDKNAKIKICIFSGKGKYPYILKPVCKDEDEYLIIKGGEKLDLTYNNPYTDGIYDENQQFYVIIMPDKNIKYSYGYERKIKLNEEQYTNINHNGKKIFKISNQKHNKKSIYYQINVCENKNSNFYYTINNSEKSLIKNDIYQECSLQEFKSFLVEFEGDGEQKAKFKYFYGPDKLLNTIEQFSKDIYLSKNDNNKELLIEFQTPFVQQIDIKIIFASEMVDKYKDFCSFEKFCKDNYDSGKLKIINKKVIANKEKALVSIDKTEFEEFLNKDVDIYLIAKSLANTLEIFYNVKSVNLNLEQLKDEKEENGENKNYLCINCGDKNEKDKKDNENIVTEHNNYYKKVERLRKNCLSDINGKIAQEIKNEINSYSINSNNLKENEILRKSYKSIKTDDKKKNKNAKIKIIKKKKNRLLNILNNLNESINKNEKYIKKNDTEICMTPEISKLITASSSNNINPQQAEEYTTDIIESLLLEEDYYYNQKKYINPYYLENEDSELTPEMRTVAVDWLVLIHFKIFKFSENTLFLAIQIFDRYLSKVDLTTEETEMLLYTSFMLASKHNEIDYVNMQETLKLSQDKFSKDQIIKMESEILNKLDFEILAPTMYEFFVLFASFLGLSQTKINKGLYILNIVLVDFHMLKYPNFMLAFAVIKLITKTVDKNLVNLIKNILNKNKIEKFLNIFNRQGYEKICNRIKLLYNTFLETKYKNIQDKFSEKEFNSVSKFTYI